MRPIDRRRFLMTCAAVSGGLLATALGFRPAAEPRTEADLSREFRPAMGSWIGITVRHPSAVLRTRALEQAFARVAHLEALLTRHRPGAPLGRLNAAGRIDDAPPELCALLERSLDLHQRTKGRFNPAVLPVLNALRDHSAATPADLPPAARRHAFTLADPAGVRLRGGRVTLAPGMGLTLDGLAKGHVADCVADALAALDVEHCLIEAGGDVRARGERAPGEPWRVGVQDPARPDRLLTVLPLTNGGLATSGNRESLLTRGYAHLIPSETGAAGSAGSQGLAGSAALAGAGLAGCSVHAADATLADALATALATLPPAAAPGLLAAFPGAGCLLALTDGSRLVAGAFPKEG